MATGPRRKDRTRAVQEVREASKHRDFGSIFDRCFKIQFCLAEEQPKAAPTPAVCHVELDDPAETALQASAVTAMIPVLVRGLYAMGGNVTALNDLAQECSESASRSRKKFRGDPCGVINDQGNVDLEMAKCADLPRMRRDLCSSNNLMMAQAAQIFSGITVFLSGIDWCWCPPFNYTPEGPLVQTNGNGETSQDSGSGTAD